jgi:hypothetical protein
MRIRSLKFVICLVLGTSGLQRRKLAWMLLHLLLMLLLNCVILMSNSVCVGIVQVFLIFTLLLIHVSKGFVCAQAALGILAAIVVGVLVHVN